MAEMEYGQQAFSAMKAAEAARAAEARMNDEGESVAIQGQAPDTAKAIKDQEAMLAERLSKSPRPAAEALSGDAEAEADAPKLTGAALKARAAELGIESGMSADDTRAAIADAEADETEELFGDARPDWASDAPAFMPDPAAAEAAEGDSDDSVHSAGVIS